MITPLLSKIGFISNIQAFNYSRTWLITDSWGINKIVLYWMMKLDIQKFLSFFTGIFKSNWEDSSMPIFKFQQAEIHWSSYEEEFTLESTLIDLIKLLAPSFSKPIRITFPGLIDWSCFKKLVTSVEGKLFELELQNKNIYKYLPDSLVTKKILYMNLKKEEVTVTVFVAK